MSRSAAREGISVSNDVVAQRVAFTAASVLLLLYAANVALRIAQIKFGAATWSIGDVGEFLLVLAGMVCFVAGLLILEARSPGPDVDASDSTTGDSR
ncbi:MAG: hypothetical protein ABI881_17105 [Betaproteobacteria bacterium]